MGEIFDGNWVEMATMVCGGLGVTVKPILRKIKGHPPCWVFRDAGNDFLNAASLAPFVLMILGVFNKGVFEQLVNAGKASLGLAGGIGALYVVKEVISYTHGK